MMRRFKVVPALLGATMASLLTACVADDGDEWNEGFDDKAAMLDDEEDFSDKTFRGDLGVALGRPIVTGNTIGLSNDFTPACISSSAPDAAYTWTAPAAGTYVFDTMGSGFDTVLELRRYSDNAYIDCNDDSAGTRQSTATAQLLAGQTVLVFIDGFSTAAGAYQLNVAASGGGGGIPTSGLHLWLRSDVGVEASGGRVSAWRDQSGNGRHGTMTTASRQPYLANGVINGLPVVRFLGAQSLTLAALVQPNVFTVFIVGRNTKASESFSMILGPAGNSPNNQLRWENGSQALFVGIGNNMPVTTSPVGNTRTFHALSARYNGSNMTVYRNGNAVSSHSFTTSGPWTLAAVGAWFSSYYLEGELAEIIIYDRVLSDAERSTVNAHLRSKYNLP